MEEGTNLNTGILTFHFADNYGAVLQAYATLRFVEKTGRNAAVINFKPECIASGYDINPFHKGGKDILIAAFVFFKRKKQHEQFNMFRRDYLKQSNTCIQKVSQIKGYQNIIVGSDQVWNLNITQDESYFLPGVCEKINKIGFAISMGKYDSEKLTEAITAYSGKFKVLSFRESKAAQLCLKYSKNVPIYEVCDPTFIIRRDEWEMIERRPKRFAHHKYILYYALEGNETLKQIVKNKSKELNLPIISIHPTANKSHIDGAIDLTNVGPREFLWLVNHADVVATNSFHGTAFSAIFRKKTIVVAHSSLGDRTNNLMQILDINLCDDNLIDFDEVDSSKLDERINNTQEMLLKYLE